MARRVAVPLGLALAAFAAVAWAQDVPPHTSVGDTHDGHLTGGGAELPLRGAGFHWETNRDNPDARYGTPALVNALVEAAAAVAEAYPGSDLAIHDLSRPGGGPIEGHGSHRSGRDADVAYYALDAAGERMNPTRSIWFARSGRERGAPRDAAARFDAERTWAFLRALFADEEITVRYVFMAPHLQRRLLAAAGDDPLRRRATRMLRRPRGRRVDPHADHLHVRIDCPEADRAHGCVD